MQTPAGTILLIGAILVAPSFTQIYVYGPMIATPGAALLVAGAGAGAAAGNRWLELPLLRFTGRISYALYLWHVPMLRLTGTTYAGAAAIPPVIVAVVLAIGSTLLLEEPLGRAWRRRRRKEPRPQDQQPTYDEGALVQPRSMGQAGAKHRSSHHHQEAA